MPFETLKDNSYPYLVFGDREKHLPWMHGKLERMRLGSTYLRFSHRGFIESRTAIHSLPSTSDWVYSSCLPFATALCQETDFARQLWFPSTVVDVPDNWQQLPHTAMTRLVNETNACSNEITKRTINIDDNRYEISLCDLIDSNLDIIYAHANGVPSVIWRQDPTSFYEYLVLALVAIYLVTSVSQNIADMFTSAHDIISQDEDTLKNDNTDKKQEENKTKQFKMLDTTSPIYIVQNCLALSILLYSFFSCVILRRDVLISLPDNALFVHLLVYSFVTIICHMNGWPSNFLIRADDSGAPVLKKAGFPGHNISLLTVSLLLLSVKIHHSFDNPYILFLCILFGWRTFVKLFMCEHKYPDQVLCAFLDLLLLFSILANGVSQTAQNEVEGIMLNLAIVCICSVAAIVTTNLFNLMILFLTAA